MDKQGLLSVISVLLVLVPAFVTSVVTQEFHLRPKQLFFPLVINTRGHATSVGNWDAKLTEWAVCQRWRLIHPVSPSGSYILKDLLCTHLLSHGVKAASHGRLLFWNPDLWRLSCSQQDMTLGLTIAPKWGLIFHGLLLQVDYYEIRTSYVYSNRPLFLKKM